MFCNVFNENDKNIPKQTTTKFLLEELPLKAAQIAVMFSHPVFLINVIYFKILLTFS